MDQEIKGQSPTFSRIFGIDQDVRSQQLGEAFSGDGRLTPFEHFYTQEEGRGKDE